MCFCGRFGQEWAVVVKCGRAQRFEPMLIIWGKLRRPIVQIPRPLHLQSGMLLPSDWREEAPHSCLRTSFRGEPGELGHMSCFSGERQSGRPGIPSMLPCLKFLWCKLLNRTLKHCVWRWCVWNLVLYHESSRNIYFLHWRSHDVSETQQFY